MAIELTIKNYRCFEDSKPAQLSIKPGLTSIVGLNNSGKSALLRFLFEFRQLFAHLGSHFNNFAQCVANGTALNLPGIIRDRMELFTNTNQRDLELSIKLSGTDLFSPDPNVPPATALVISVRRSDPSVAFQYIEPLGRIARPAKLGTYGTALEHHSVRADVSAILKALLTLSNTLYLPAFRNAVNVGASTQYFDIQIGDAFVSLWKGYKTGPTKSQNEATERITDDIRRILGFRTLSINPSEDSKSIQLFINGKSYRLDEVGAGIAQFVIVLINAAIRRPDYVLCDEPELNLHPSLQLDFLTTLTSCAEKGIIYATHSYGLARSASHQIYAIRRSDSDTSELYSYEAAPKLAEFLGSLSYAGYQQLGYEKVLLVEGPKDVLAVQQFLRMYQKDHKVLLLQLGGNSLINGDSAPQLIEVQRICPHVFALFDSERQAVGAPLASNRAAFAKVCAQLKIDHCVTERRAIENYLTLAAIQKVKGDKYRQLGPYELLKDMNPAWSKDENWRIAREMDLSEIEATDIGQFIKRI